MDMDMDMQWSQIRLRKNNPTLSTEEEQKQEQEDVVMGKDKDYDNDDGRGNANVLPSTMTDTPRKDDPNLGDHIESGSGDDQRQQHAMLTNDIDNNNNNKKATTSKDVLKQEGKQCVCVCVCLALIDRVSYRVPPNWIMSLDVCFISFPINNMDTMCCVSVCVSHSSDFEVKNVSL